MSWCRFFCVVYSNCKRFASSFYNSVRFSVRLLERLNTQSFKTHRDILSFVQGHSKTYFLVHLLSKPARFAYFRKMSLFSRYLPSKFFQPQIKQGVVKSYRTLTQQVRDQYERSLNCDVEVVLVTIRLPFLYQFDI